MQTDRPECFWCDAPLCPDGLCPNGCARADTPEFWQLQGLDSTASDDVWQSLADAMKECKRSE